MKKYIIKSINFRYKNLKMISIQKNQIPDLLKNSELFKNGSLVPVAHTGCVFPVSSSSPN